LLLEETIEDGLRALMRTNGNMEESNKY